MSAIFILVPLSIVIATAFLIAFIWAVRSGQFDDTCTPSMRVLLDETGQSVPMRGRSSISSPEIGCAGTVKTSRPPEAALFLDLKSSIAVLDDRERCANCTNKPEEKIQSPQSNPI